MKGPLLSAEQKTDIQSIGRVISEAQKDLRDGEVDPALLKALGMTRGRFAAFVERYARRIGQVKQMADRTDRPNGTIQGAFAIPGSGARQKGRGTDGRLGDVRGSEKLAPDQIRKLYEQRAKNVSPEYRKHVEAYFRAVSEAAPKAAGASPAKGAPGASTRPAK